MPKRYLLLAIGCSLFLVSSTTAGPPDLDEIKVEKKVSSFIFIDEAPPYELVKPSAMAEPDIRYDVVRAWHPFKYLVRKPKTKVSEITARILHLDPGLRGC